ncbi:MAG: hypothetical protein DWQ05_14545 [Calditrichaeota bacterium]|nr:MAG: hypothetical protein DWQ05_14545 [Calditrichota bacterium]
MKKTSFAIILLMVFWSTAQAQIDNTQTITKTGTTAAQFLKIGVDARAASMGGAFVGIGGDISSIYWNPAGLGHITGMQFVAVHNQWLADMDFNFLAFGMELPSIGVFAASVTYLGVPDDKVRTIAEPNGTGELFSANDFAVTLSLARQLTDKFSLGGNVKYLRQSIWNESAKTIAVDIGALFETPFYGIRLGASISNFGGDMRLEGRDLRFSMDPDPNGQGNVEFVNATYETDRYPLPLFFRVGIAGELMKTDNTRITFGIDSMNPNDNTESVNSGVEFAFNEMFFLRTGYKALFQDDSEEGFTFGGGVHYRLWGSSTQLKLDYAYADFGMLETVNRFSLGVSF